MSHSIVPHIQPCNKFNCFISFYIIIYFKSVQITCFIWFHSLISFKVPHIQKCNIVNGSYLVLHSHILQQSHLFNIVSNSVVLSNFSFMSPSIVPHIQPCNKFNSFISFYILIYFKSVQITSFIWFHSLISFKVPHIQKCNKVNCLISYILISFNSLTYSTVSQIQLYYLLSRSYLIQLFQHIQQCNKFNSLIWFNSIISFNSFKYSTFSKIKFYYLFHIHISFNTPTYSKGSQIQLYNLISHSHLIQQFHIFNNVTNLTLLSRFTFSSIYNCHKFISFIWFNTLISCNSPTYPKVQQSQWSYLVYILIPLNSPTHSTVSHIQQCHKFNYLISFTFSSISIV